MKLPEDVYYVSRDERGVYALNALTSLPPELREVELEAIEIMGHRSTITMGLKNTAYPSRPSAAVERVDNMINREHGLYYIDRLGHVWKLSDVDARPDLAGPEMDYAKATLSCGLKNLRDLRQQAWRARS